MVKSYFIYGNVLKVERYTVINVMRNTTAELTILLKLLAFKKCAFAFSRIYVVISFFRMIYSLYTYLQWIFYKFRENLFFVNAQFYM